MRALAARNGSPSSAAASAAAARSADSANVWKAAKRCQIVGSAIVGGSCAAGSNRFVVGGNRCGSASSSGSSVVAADRRAAGSPGRPIEYSSMGFMRRSASTISRRRASMTSSGSVSPVQPGPSRVAAGVSLAGGGASARGGASSAGVHATATTNTTPLLPLRACVSSASPLQAHRRTRSEDLQPMALRKPAIDATPSAMSAVGYECRNEHRMMVAATLSQGATPIWPKN